MTENQDKAEEGLVIYRAQPIDVPRQIEHLKIPLSEVTLENRALNGDGMYSGVFSNLMINPKGIVGCAYLRYFTVANVTPHSADGLFERMTNTLFRERTINPMHAAEIEGKKYIRRWEVVAGSHYKEGLVGMGFGEVCVPDYDVLATLKSNTVNQRQQVISNELLRNLYDPLFDALVQLFYHIAEH